MKMAALNLICTYPKIIPLCLPCACLTLFLVCFSLLCVSFSRSFLGFVQPGMGKLASIPTFMQMERSIFYSFWFFLLSSH